MGRLGPTVRTTDFLNLAAEDQDEERFDLQPFMTFTYDASLHGIPPNPILPGKALQPARPAPVASP